MKKVDYEHFSRFLMPHSVAARADELYFCVKRAVLDENRYASDLWVLRDGKAKRLTSAGDVSGFWLTDEGVVFSALREKRDKERAEAGEPLTVLYVLPYDGGEARELCRLDCSVGEVRFLGNGRFLFTATVSRDWERPSPRPEATPKRPPRLSRRSAPPARWWTSCPSGSTAAAL